MAAVDAVLTSGLSPSARVLVVEPDDAAREVTVMMIQGQGFRAMEASGSEEALALAERFEPGMVLVNDAIAQDRDYWLLRGLRQISSNIAIYVLANVPSEAEAAAALQRGAAGYRETGKLPELLQEVRDIKNQ